jgi:serine/threonine protein kinase
MPLSVGDKLGPFEIVAPLGAGGMGEVWKARDTRLDRIVAVKQLKGRHSERFEREARAIATLNHPHICQIYATNGALCSKRNRCPFHERNPDRTFSESPTIRSKLGAGTSNDRALDRRHLRCTRPFQPASGSSSD